MTRTPVSLYYQDYNPSSLRLWLRAWLPSSGASPDLEPRLFLQPQWYEVSQPLLSKVSYFLQCFSTTITLRTVFFTTSLQPLHLPHAACPLPSIQPISPLPFTINPLNHAAIFVSPFGSTKKLYHNHNSITSSSITCVLASTLAVTFEPYMWKLDWHWQS